MALALPVFSLEHLELHRTNYSLQLRGVSRSISIDIQQPINASNTMRENNPSAPTILFSFAFAVPLGWYVPYIIRLRLCLAE